MGTTTTKRKPATKAKAKRAPMKSTARRTSAAKTKR